MSFLNLVGSNSFTYKTHALYLKEKGKTEGNSFIVCQAAGKKTSFREQGMSVCNMPELVKQR